MLDVSLVGAGKKYQLEWIFHRLNLDITHNSKIAITGSNGSGKSTLLKCISGQLPLTEGKINYHYKGKEIEESSFYEYMTFSAPYMELPEEFTLKELLTFHFRFKKPIYNWDIGKIANNLKLEKSLNKQIIYFSSGMKQRLKLGLCFFSDVSLILLDEPMSNLDENGKNWYLDLVEKYGKNKSIIIGSNDREEFPFCPKIIAVEDFKYKNSL